MKKLNVLVVDDEAGIRSGINRILRNFTVGYPFMEEDFGFELIDAETGEFLWAHKQDTLADVHGNTPIYENGFLYCTAGAGNMTEKSIKIVRAQ